MRRKLLAAITLTALVAIPAIAEAAEGFATANVNMRSGPSTQYPAVTMIPVGTPLEINGCLNETPWCDVSFFGGRGWVAGQYIQATYQSRRIYVGPQYYRPLGIPTVTFNFDDYWDRYYRGRDFYRDRDRWRHGPGWGYRRPDANWDQRPDRNPGWDRGSDWNDGSGNWDRRPYRNRDWGDQQDNEDWRRQRDRRRDWGGQQDNQDWGRQQPDNNQGWGGQDRRRDNNRQDDQQRRPPPQQQPQQQQPQQQQQPRQQQPQPQQGQNNPRPNAGSPGPYSPDHVDPCPVSQPDCRMTPRGFNR